MGVIGLFSYLLRNYPTAFNVRQNPSELRIESVYLDGNALLYPISEVTKIPEEIAKTLLMVSQQYGQVYQCTCNIYMDGPAHMGKIRQQRMRRFLYEPTSIVVSHTTEVGERSGEVPIPMTTQSSLLGTSVPTIFEWSSAVFTPGTEVMERIHQYIVQHKDEYSRVGIYSSYHDAGEGEHKIIRHIKYVSMTRSSNNPYRVGIVGKDADLLLLAMGITTGEGWNVQPYILRHNDRLGEGGKTNGYTPTDPIFTIDASLLRERILASLTPTGRHSIWDFIIATFLIGNDFLPPVPEMGDIYSSIPMIISLSPHLYSRTQSGGTINWDGFIRFIQGLISFVRDNPKVRSVAYGKWLQSADTESMSIEAFEILYYFHVSSFKVDADKVVFAWLTTIYWIFIYYHDGMDSASIAWQYPLAFSPTLYTLSSSSVLNDKPWRMIERISTRKVNPLTPVQALAAVLPVWLHNLIPYETRQRMRTIPQYYPYAFQILNPTGDPLIPIIPYEVVSSL